MSRCRGGGWARGVIVLVALATFGPPSVEAHLNSPHIYLEENAGAYPVILIVHMPPAIPGEAEVQVRIQDLQPGENVVVQVRDVPPQGEGFAPAWRTAEVSQVDPGFFRTYLPLMIPGLWHAEVRIQGARRGEGTSTVPINARLSPPVRMSAGLSALLLVLLAIFLVSLWKILQSLGRDAQRPAGQPATTRDRRRGMLFAAGGLLFFTLKLGALGWLWYVVDVRHYRASASPLESRISVLTPPPEQGKRLSMKLELRSRSKQWLDFEPDHGKMMHMAVVRLPDFTYFLHVHPRSSAPGVFEFEFTPPQAGTYKFFADVLHASGVGETVTQTLEVAPGERASSEAAFDDPDDSESEQPAFGSQSTRSGLYRASPEIAIRWEQSGTGQLRKGDFQKLAFDVVGPDGRAVDGLEPYMGMAGHLMILRDDAQVFAHIHPMGTLGGRMAMTMPAGMDHAAMGHGAAKLPSRVTFPFGFPDSGRYRMFAQVKWNGRIYTGVFDATVE